MKRDSKASLFSLYAMKLGVIKAEGKCFHVHKLPSPSQGRRQRKVVPFPFALRDVRQVAPPTAAPHIQPAADDWRIKSSFLLLGFFSHTFIKVPSEPTEDIETTVLPVWNLKEVCETPPQHHQHGGCSQLFQTADEDISSLWRTMRSSKQRFGPWCWYLPCGIHFWHRTAKNPGKIIYFRTKGWIVAADGHWD